MKNRNTNYRVSGFEGVSLWAMHIRDMEAAMAKRDTRRVLVIKDIPSNIIEEAILILKCDPGEEKSDNKKSIPSNKKRWNSDYMLKEAEAIINSYVKTGRFKDAENIRIEPAPAIKKQNTLTNTAINVLLVGSIAALVIVFTQLF